MQPAQTLYVQKLMHLCSTQKQLKRTQVAGATSGAHSLTPNHTKANLEAINVSSTVLQCLLTITTDGGLDASRDHHTASQ